MIEIVLETGHQGPRTENPYKVMVRGEIIKDKSFWTEADAIRYAVRTFGVLPTPGVRQVGRNN